VADRHLLGRTPDGLEQYRARSAVYDAQGYDAFIDSFFDDGEYDEFYDEWTVPFVRGHLSTSRLSMAAFTHNFYLNRGQSTSDKANPRIMTNKIPLNKNGILSIPIAVVNPGSTIFMTSSDGAAPGSWQGGVSGSSMARTAFGVRQGAGVAASDRKMYRIEVTGYSQGRSSNGRAGVTFRSRGTSAYRNDKFSEFRRANKVFMVPYDELSNMYVKIHKDGGKIASVQSA
jgi:phycoerythrin-associated linker protein